jgi:hypothetical protein|nr:MAG TPA: hypothetical protein [Caudoviricetes sp.]
MKGSNNFDIDKVSGEKAENEVSALIMEKCKQGIDHIEFNRVRENGKDYDLNIFFGSVNDTLLVEVKNDLSSSETGNAAIETGCRGKDSGITTTKALYWIYSIFINGKVNYFLYETEALINHLWDNRDRFWYTEGGDQWYDGKRNRKCSDLIIVKSTEMMRIGKNISQETDIFFKKLYQYHYIDLTNTKNAVRYNCLEKIRARNKERGII